MAPLDLNRLASSAAEAYLQEGRQGTNGKVEERTKRRLGGGAAVATGAGLILAGRAVYRRLRPLDLERLGHAAEQKLKG
ncbi:MAG: hypothetical protein ACJ76D_01525 [Solirubrobacterales bacterium]